MKYIIQLILNNISGFPSCDKMLYESLKSNAFLVKKTEINPSLYRKIQPFSGEYCNIRY